MNGRPLPYLKAWVIFFLVATVGGAVLGGIAGAILGAGLSLAKVSLTEIKITAAIAGFLIGMPLSYFTFRWVVSEFIVKAVMPRPTLPAPPAGGAPAGEDPPVLQRSA